LAFIVLVLSFGGLHVRTHRAKRRTVGQFPAPASRMGVTTTPLRAARLPAAAPGLSHSHRERAAADSSAFALQG